MKQEDFSLRSIAFAAFAPTLLHGLGKGAILPVIALSARELGATVPQAALMVTLIGIGSLVNNVPASLITMRWGERLAMVAAALLCAAAMALCAWTDNLWAFAAGSVLVGASQSIFNIARQSYLGEAVPAEFRARAMSTLGGVARIGSFVGPFAGAAAIYGYGLSGAYSIGAVVMVVAALIASRIPDLPGAKEVAASGGNPSVVAAPTWRSTVRDHQHVFLTLGIGAILVSAVRSSRQAVIPLWADHLAIDPSVASLIYGLSAGIEMLVFYPAGQVMDRKGRRWVAVPSMLIMGLALLLTPLTVGSISLLLAACLIGFGNGIGSGMMMTLGADHSPRTGRAHFLGVWRLIADIGAASGPGLLAFIAAVLSLGTGIAVTGLISLAAAAQLAYWIPRAGRGRDSSRER
jgi:MFS family permease